jgi:hypothetical protein
MYCLLPSSFVFRHPSAIGASVFGLHQARYILDRKQYIAPMQCAPAAGDTLTPVLHLSTDEREREPGDSGEGRSWTPSGGQASVADRSLRLQMLRYAA